MGQLTSRRRLIGRDDPSPSGLLPLLTVALRLQSRCRCEQRGEPKSRCMQMCDSGVGAPAFELRQALGGTNEFDPARPRRKVEDFVLQR